MTTLDLSLSFLPIKKKTQIIAMSVEPMARRLHCAHASPLRVLAGKNRTFLLQLPVPWSSMSRNSRVDMCRVLSFLVRFSGSQRWCALPLTLLSVARPLRKICFQTSTPSRVSLFFHFPDVSKIHDLLIRMQRSVLISEFVHDDDAALMKPRTCAIASAPHKLRLANNSVSNSPIKRRTPDVLLVSTSPLLTLS